MKFVFTDKKVTLPASVHAYAEKKVGKMDRYFKNEGEASVVFSVIKGLLSERLLLFYKNTWKKAMAIYTNVCVKIVKIARIFLFSNDFDPL